MANINQSEEENFLFGKNKGNPFTLPNDYFELLPSRIINKIEVEQELLQHAILSGIISKSFLKEQGLIVPQNYFTKNANLLEYRYELSQFTELNKVPKPSLKPLEDGYFDTVSDKILKQIEQRVELKNYSALAEIKKEKTFTVAPNYFETIADRVKERYHASQERQISTFEQVLNLFFKPRIVVVYSIILIIGVGAFLYFNREDTSAVDCKTLACLERQELLNERTIQNLDDENLYDLVDVEELDKQLSATDSLSIDLIDSLPKK